MVCFSIQSCFACMYMFISIAYNFFQRSKGGGGGKASDNKVHALGV